MPDIQAMLYQKAPDCIQAVEPRPTDTELPKALSLQRTWLELPSVKKRRLATGWNSPIHHSTRVTYQDVRDTPRYNWHRWMIRAVKEEA